MNDESKNYNFSIEIIAFYEIVRDDEQKTISGTMHVRLLDIDLDIRGIFVRKRQDSTWFLRLPSNKAINDEGKWVAFPCVAYPEFGKTKALLEAIRLKGEDFITQYIEKQSKPTEQPKAIEPISKPSIPQKIAPKQASSNKIWVDPPKRTLPRKAARK